MLPPGRLDSVPTDPPPPEAPFTLPVTPPVKPMLAKLSREVPTGDGWRYEPKWDGFRCVVFREGDHLQLSSRNERPFDRYFPELREPLLAALPDRCVVDGEIVVPDRDGRGLDFDALLQRIHPAASRVKLLAEQTPASFVAFDLLALGDEALLDRPLDDRRALLESQVRFGPPVYLTPVSADPAVAQEWFSTFEGAGLDGVVAKRADSPYTFDKRTMVKVKHERTADCVVAGYRVHKDGNGVGSLLLGLFDDTGRLHHVGVAAAFTTRFRAELLAFLEPYRRDALVDHPWREWAEAQAHEAGRLPGAVSRWNAGKDLSFEPLRPELVVEVAYD